MDKTLGWAIQRQEAIDAVASADWYEPGSFDEFGCPKDRYQEVVRLAMLMVGQFYA